MVFECVYLCCGLNSKKKQRKQEDAESIMIKIDKITYTNGKHISTHTHTHTDWHDMEKR